MSTRHPTAIYKLRLLHRPVLRQVDLVGLILRSGPTPGRVDLLNWPHLVQQATRPRSGPEAGSDEGGAVRTDEDRPLRSLEEHPVDRRGSARASWRRAPNIIATGRKSIRLEEALTRRPEGTA